ncbi:MAG: hypothetical protein SVV67_08780 [Bacillota bacterium]|nr:hypothetical protein [Bacillota bacterium]
MEQDLVTETEPTDKYKPFDKLSKAEKLKKARRGFANAVALDRTFQKSALLAYKFYSGDQYTSEERHILQEQGRPDLTCNLIKPTVELIKGVNEQNKIDVKAQATEPSDGFLADVLDDCKKKMYDLEDIAMKEDDAFENFVCTGRGFCAVDIAPDPNHPGEIRTPVVSVMPTEIKVDPSFSGDDLDEASEIYWHKWVSYEDFAIRYPQHIKDIDDIIHGESFGDFMDIDADNLDDFSGIPVDTPEDDEYSSEIETGYYDRSNNQIRVVHKEYWCVYDRYYGVNPSTGIWEEFEAKNLKALTEAIPGFQYETIKDKKVKWFQFTGHKVLFDGDSPIPYEGYSIVGEFCYKDKSAGHVSHFGVIRDLIDPQREANKRWSQTLNLYLQQHQGGSFVELDAIADIKEWEDTIRTPGADTFVNPGALSGGKIQAKPIPQLPQGAYQLHEQAKDLIKKVSGIDNDLLGVAHTSGEAGVTIRLRQQQGLTMLAKLFKNHHRMQEQLAKRIYAIIMKYMPDSQIQRILGDSEQYKFRGDLVADMKNGIIAPIRNLKDLKYNIDVEESPTNMTKTMAQLAVFMDMMGKGFPTDPKTVINRLDLPEQDKMEWIKFVEQSQQSQQQQAQMQMQTQQAMIQAQVQDAAERRQIEAGRLQTDQMKAQSDAQDKAAQRALDYQKLQQEEQDDRYDFTVDMLKLDMQSKELVMSLIKELASRPMQLPARPGSLTQVGGVG